MLEALMTPIDIYCERVGSAFRAEPLNAASNIAFVIAGLWGVRAARRRQAGGFIELLGWWVVAIGAGSGLFHTFANRLTIWADVLPIAGFTLAYTIFALRHVLERGWGRTLAAFGGFYLAAGLLTAMVPEWLRAASNGSTGYLPAFLALVVFGAAMLARGKPAGWFCLAAAAIFTLSLAFRAIDMRVCGMLPTGTHFLWHLLNATMLGVLLAAAASPGTRRTVHAEDGETTPGRKKAAGAGAPAA